MKNMFVHAHQRCGYSDSPFARIHYFYTAGSRNGLEGVGNSGYTHTIIKKESSKRGSQLSKPGKNNEK